VEIHTRSTTHGNITDTFLGLQTRADEPLAVFRSFLPKEPGTVVAQLVFGGCAYHEAAAAAMGGVSWPLMWQQGDSCSGNHVAGTQALTVQGTDIRRLEWKGRIAGSCWADADADYCLLAGIQPDDREASRPVQARQVFENMERTLARAGMGFKDVVRTWMFLDGLLDWYGDFNAVRTGYFKERGIFEHLVPASTGIGAANPTGSALLAGALAVRPKHAGVTIEAVDSPLQCPALNYRSSFSRAIEIGFPDRRFLVISGTAGIAPDGTTMHPGDVKAQVDRTMSVVQAILESRGMNWNSAVRALAYFERMDDVPLLAEYCRAHGIRDLPVINAHATVCRPELLFEIEVDAAAAR
jgi:enamine deaminase RidA (YjgF/YER057c/UK114 family)